MVPVGSSSVAGGDEWRGKGEGRGNANRARVKKTGGAVGQLQVRAA